MPLVPKIPECNNCKRIVDVTGIKMVCDTCSYENKIGEFRMLGDFVSNWPRHHDEFMSLSVRFKCSVCGEEFTEYFPNGRVSLDCLPSKYENRVFVGGNYDNMGNLRNIKNAVNKIGGQFVPILPFDDFQIPKGHVYEWDLRLLHNCKYAIFDVTEPGGELFEIARCSEYGVQTLFVYQARGATREPTRARTMLLESGSHEHHNYQDNEHLEKIVGEFLLQKAPASWRRAVDLKGYYLDEYSVNNKIFSNGEAEHRYAYKGLHVHIPDFRVSELTHDFTITSGCIVSGSFKFSGDRVSWKRDSTRSSERAEVGVVQIEPQLDCKSRPVDYVFSFKTKNAYMLNKSQLAELGDEELSDPFLSSGIEFASREIMYPTELFTISVEFPEGYSIYPQAQSYFSTEPRIDGIKIPPDSFSFDGKIAELKVLRPRVNYRYSIIWEVPD